MAALKIQGREVCQSDNSGYLGVAGFLMGFIVVFLFFSIFQKCPR